MIGLNTVVLFVPQGCTNRFSYGVLLDGTGQIWFKDIQLEIVDDLFQKQNKNYRNSKVFHLKIKLKQLQTALKWLLEKKRLKREVKTIDVQVNEGKIPEKSTRIKTKIAQESLLYRKLKVIAIEAKINIQLFKIKWMEK